MCTHNQTQSDTIRHTSTHVHAFHHCMPYSSAAYSLGAEHDVAPAAAVPGSQGGGAHPTQLYHVCHWSATRSMKTPSAREHNSSSNCNQPPVHTRTHTHSLTQHAHSHSLYSRACVCVYLSMHHHVPCCHRFFAELLQDYRQFFVSVRVNPDHVSHLDKGALFHSRACVVPFMNCLMHRSAPSSQRMLCWLSFPSLCLLSAASA